MHCLVLDLAHLIVQILNLSLLIDSRFLTFLRSGEVQPTNMSIADNKARGSQPPTLLLRKSSS